MTGVLDASDLRATPAGATDGLPPSDAQAVSPSARQVGRRSIPWIVLGVIAVLVALLGILLGGGRSAGVPLDPSNAGLAGGKAVAEVLRQQGVDVQSATTLAGVQDHATDDTTVLVYDPDGNLDDSGYDRLTSVASTIVVVEPGYRALQRLAPRVRAAGGPAAASETLAAGCDLPAAVRAERIDPRATANLRDVSVAGTFRIASSASADTTGCFADGDRYSLVATTSDGRDIALVGSAAVLTNDGVARAGNAALALNLLGGHHTLVWYLPSIADRAVTGPPDLAALTPGWVTPVMVLLVLVFVAAAFWRGRRFGPLVVENLPVVVRAGETREGRARLYQRSSARLRALDSLRIGSLGRLAALTGLPRAATATEIADAVATVTHRDRNSVRTILIDGVPRTDADLIAQSDHLAELERATAAAVTPGHPGPTGRMDA